MAKIIRIGMFSKTFLTFNNNMDLNSKIIKLSGKVEMLPEQNLENGQAVTLIVQGEVVAVQENNLQDGTFDRIYKVKISTAELQ